MMNFLKWLKPGAVHQKKRSFVPRFASVLLLAALCLCACSGGNSSDSANIRVKNPVQGGTLKIYCQKPDTYNPLRTQIHSVSRMLSMVYEPLYALDSAMNPVPVLARTHSVSPDGLMYSIYLQEGVQFHDGAGLTARDVVYSCRQIMETESLYRTNLANVSDVRAASDYQVDIYLAQRDAGFLSLLTFPIIRENSANTTMSGTGPYRIAQAAKGKTMSLSVNTEWHGSHLPYIDTVSVVILDDAAAAADAFEINLVDVFERPYDSAESVSVRKESGRVVVPTNVLTFVGVNSRHPVLADPKVRSALSLAIDRNKIISQALFENAIATQLPLHPDSALFPQGYEWTAYDAKAAAQAFADCGFSAPHQDGVLEREGADGERQRLSLSLLVCSEDSRRYQIAELLSSMMRDMQIALTVETLDYETYLQRIFEGDFDMYVGDVDLLNNFDLSALLYAAEEDISLSGYQSNQMNALLESMRIASDDSVRVAAYEQLAAFFRQETPFLPICFNHNAFYFNSNISGVSELFFESPYLSCYDWFVNAEGKGE